MTWYANQKARHEAKRADLQRQRAAGVAAALFETSQVEADRLREKTLSMQDERDAARRARKRDRKLSRRGTAGPS